MSPARWGDGWTGETAQERRDSVRRRAKRTERVVWLVMIAFAVATLAFVFLGAREAGIFVDCMAEVENLWVCLGGEP